MFFFIISKTKVHPLVIAGTDLSTLSSPLGRAAGVHWVSPQVLAPLPY